GGSYYLEVLTNQIEAEAEKLINEIDSLGGAIKCIEEGFIQKKIEESAYRYQKEIENKSRKIVGVNIFTSKDEKERKFKILRVAKELQRKRAAQLKLFRNRRSKLKVQKSLEQLRKAVDTNENLFNPILECVKNRATLGEICDVLREAYGEYDKIKRS
ncbi:MAG: methylmalonyl-CoA mutase family protein, partial [candidate division WOR-3 bacterium]|nr:methylmalonyl-CoA mutase family protein [candidate division WOR-3 bacterium]